MGGTVMSNNGILILAISWIVSSPLWFFVIENTAMGIIWVCGGIMELIIALTRLSKEKKADRFLGTFSEKGIE